MVKRRFQQCKTQCNVVVSSATYYHHQSSSSLAASVSPRRLGPRKTQCWLRSEMRTATYHTTSSSSPFSRYSLSLSLLAFASLCRQYIVQLCEPLPYHSSITVAALSSSSSLCLSSNLKSSQRTAFLAKVIDWNSSGTTFLLEKPIVVVYTEQRRVATKRLP